jgi:hypothetical protein
VKNYVYDTNLGDITIKGVTKLDQWNKQLLNKLADRKRTLKPKELVFAFSVLPYSQNEIAEAVKQR